METFKEVEAAKALMREAAVNWSVMRWLSEKKKVRRAADNANELLDETNANIKAAWGAELKAAYEELSGGSKNGAAKLSDETKTYLKQVIEADETAYKARMLAEDTFDRAERRLSTSMAREGAQQAIVSWELHEKAIEIAKLGLEKTSSNS